MRLVAKTDIGSQRNENQDSYRAGRTSGDVVWGVVCDGMGGARGGRMASTLAAAVFERVVEAGAEHLAPAQSVQPLLAGAMEQANRVVHQKGSQTPELAGMGTTAVGVLVHDGVAEYTHVGDSRLYLFRNAHLYQLTRDHSMVQELVDNGRLTEEQAQNHPRKNLITRALGVEAAVEADFGEKEVTPHDILLLCSDGLTNCVTPEQIELILEKTPFFHTADALVRQALAGGGYDNITVLLIQIEPVEEKNG